MATLTTTSSVRGVLSPLSVYSLYHSPLARPPQLPRREGPKPVLSLSLLRTSMETGSRRQDEWRVKPGGLFHPRQVTYSKETHELLKELLRESKLTMMQRKCVSDSLRRGDPLPLPGRGAAPRHPPSTPRPPPPPTAASIPKRRSYKAIEESGAYEPTPSPAQMARLDYTKEKMRLQRIMAYGKNTPENKEVSKSKSFNLSKKELFEHLLNEIKDREEFLNDMEKIGQGKQYRQQIKMEIDEKVRLMEEWDKKLFDSLDTSHTHADIAVINE